MSELRPYLPKNKKGKMLLLSNKERESKPFEIVFSSLAKKNKKNT